jgi:hypothetical protein
MRFFIRDVVFVTVIVSTICGWAVDRGYLAASLARVGRLNAELNATLRRRARRCDVLEQVIEESNDPMLQIKAKARQLEFE